MDLTIDVPGGAIWADDTGGDGLPLLLLHPGVGDSRVWQPVLDRLGDSYRVIRYDSHGFGRSPAATAPFTLLGELTAVLDALEVPRAVLVGCSQGGASAVNLAIEDPARVAALVLVSPGLSDFPWPEAPELDAIAEPLVEAKDVAGMARFEQTVWGRASDGDDLVHELLLSANRAMFANGEYQLPNPPSVARLGEIGAPSVVLVGDQDYGPAIDCARTAAAGIPGCELVEVPGGDHFLPHHVPDLVTDTVRRYHAAAARG
jgi:3-oxoadipate enol-lactonase